MLRHKCTCHLHCSDASNLWVCVGQAVNGVPACADGEVMNTLMRQTWNFTGSIVSDVRNHHFDQGFQDMT